MLEWIALAQPPQSGVEDAEHVLRSFVATKGVWMRALPHDVKEEFFNLTFHEWLSRNLFDNSFVPNDEEWLIRFVILCWLLWKRKCSLLLASELGVIEDILVKGNISIVERSIPRREIGICLLQIRVGLVHRLDGSS
ncbi:hypothetical protein V6N11_063582 [Hibiscus sabdariffa]|uniref:Uncharacterized protein n=1 Tax=Hibiscus sabdariffa TaxID=183260 RepID=A0ABR1Z9C7_9ROSI